MVTGARPRAAGPATLRCGPSHSPSRRSWPMPHRLPVDPRETHHSARSRYWRTQPRGYEPNRQPLQAAASAATDHRPAQSPAAAVRRMRMGPLAVDGSTTRPPCVNSTCPAATSLRPARRAGSISARHDCSSSDEPTKRAASLGQILLPGERAASSWTIAASSRSSTLLILRRRQASEQ